MNLQQRLDELTQQLQQTESALDGALTKHDYELAFQRHKLLTAHIETIKHVLGL